MTREPELITTRDVAEMFGVARSTVTRWAEKGLIPCVWTPSGFRRYARRAIEKQLKTGRPDVRQTVPTGRPRG